MKIYDADCSPFPASDQLILSWNIGTLEQNDLTF